MANGLLVLLMLVAIPSAQAAPSHALDIKVIHATAGGEHVDPRIKKLAAELKTLKKFTAFALKDEATMELPLGSSGRMQLPGKQWMSVQAKAMTAQGKLRLEILVEKGKFKTIVAVAAGATVMVRGPSFEDGTLVLAVIRRR